MFWEGGQHNRLSQVAGRLFLFLLTAFWPLDHRISMAPCTNIDALSHRAGYSPLGRQHVLETFLRILTTFLGKNPQKSIIISTKRPKHPNYDGFLWVFPRKVVRIRMNSRNSLYNAPAKKVYKCYLRFSSSSRLCFCKFLSCGFRGSAAPIPITW